MPRSPLPDRLAAIKTDSYLKAELAEDDSPHRGDHFFVICDKNLWDGC